MSEFNPQKLSVYYGGNCDGDSPMKGRKYSLSHSDETGELVLTVGTEFYYPDDQTVLAELNQIHGCDIMDVYIQVDGAGGKKATDIRNEIFRRELPLALTAIIYGDRAFLSNNGLMDACIRVKFQSRYCDYNSVEQWGKIRNFCYEEQSFFK